MHRIYLRLTPSATLVEKQERGSVAIECPNDEIQELCKWLRLTADSLDGRLSASELGHLRDTVVSQERTKAFLEAIDICKKYPRELSSDERLAGTYHATKISVLIVERAEQP
jgi:hypothetical protein